MLNFNSFLESRDLLRDYAENEFNTSLVLGNVGALYHSTSLTRALSILREGAIETSGVAYDKGAFDYVPWFKKPENKKDLYGNFVYLTKDSKNFWGVGDSDVTFCINGDKLKNIRRIYSCNDKTIEGHLHLVEGSIPIEYIHEIYCNSKSFNKISAITDIKVILR